MTGLHPGMITPPTVRGVVDPACESRSHNTRWAWEKTGCICRDPELWEACLEADRRRKRIKVPSLASADRLVAQLIADGYRMDAATKSDRRMAAIMLRRRGRSLTEVSVLLGISPQTALRWTVHTEHLTLNRRGRRADMCTV